MMRWPEPRSLRLRLLLALVPPLLVISTIGAVLDYHTARSLIGATHDRALASTAIGLAARVETDRDGDMPEHLGAMARAVGRLSDSDGLAYLVLDGEGRRISGDTRLEPLIRSHPEANPAFSDARFQGHDVRTVNYAYEGPDGRATIIVAEALGKRADAARRILLPTITTNLAMGAAVVVAAVLAIGFALAPLDALGRRVEGHAVQALRPMRLSGLHNETRPLVRALNRLMARVRRTAQERQDFIDNTAHQLRTPLAGLQAQVTLLAAEALPPAAQQRVQGVQAAAQRLAHLTHQMLSLARAGDAAAAPAQPVDLPDLLRDAASACLDSAIAKGTDLGFDAAPAMVSGSPWMLKELLVNLVDNAIQHTPGGSTVTARCGSEHDRAFLEVEDDGPGIPEADRPRALERYVRLAPGASHGSGLGLAIVGQIAARHGASVHLHTGREGRGLKVTVRFPPLAVPD